MISSWSKPNSRHNLKLSLNLCDFVASPTFQLQTLSLSLQTFKIYPILTQIRVVETTLVPHLSPTGARSYLLMLSSPKKTLFVNIFSFPSRFTQVTAFDTAYHCVRKRCNFLRKAMYNVFIMPIRIL